VEDESAEDEGGGCERWRTGAREVEEEGQRRGRRKRRVEQKVSGVDQKRRAITVVVGSNHHYSP